MYVIRGGVYTDTTFTKLESEEEYYGPFKTYEEAVSKWKSLVGWKVDICCHRLFVKPV